MTALGKAQACGLPAEAEPQRSEPYWPLPPGPLWETLSLLSVLEQPVPTSR